MSDTFNKRKGDCYKRGRVMMRRFWFGFGILDIVKIFVYLFKRISIGKEGLGWVRLFFIKVLGILNTNGSTNEGFNDNKLLRCVVVGVSMDISIGFGIFVKYLMCQ